MSHRNAKLFLFLILALMIAVTSGCVIPVTIDCTPFYCTP